MNQRYQGTLANDPDLMLTISLTNVLIFNVDTKVFIFILIYVNYFFNVFNFQDPTVTQWTNVSLCGVPGIPTYLGRTPLLNNCTAIYFGNYMNNIASSLPFSFDHAVAIIPPTLVI